MLKKLVEHHEIDASFLEVPLSFFYRTTDEEQSFCVPWTVVEDDRSVRACTPYILNEEISLLTTRRNLLHFPVCRVQRPSE